MEEWNSQAECGGCGGGGGEQIWTKVPRDGKVLLAFAYLYVFFFLSFAVSEFIPLKSYLVTASALKNVTFHCSVFQSELV